MPFLFYTFFSFDLCVEYLALLVLRPSVTAQGFHQKLDLMFKKSWQLAYGYGDSEHLQNGQFVANAVGNCEKNPVLDVCKQKCNAISRKPAW